MKLSQFLPYKLSVLTNRISRGISNYYRKKFNISISQWRVLVILSQHELLTATDIVNLSQMDKVRISRTMKTLLDRRLIRRDVNPDDARARNYCLSDSGMALVDEVIPPAQRYEKDLLKALTAAERKQLNRIIEKLNGKLDQLQND